jgi:hypothetical protein
MFHSDMAFQLRFFAERQKLSYRQPQDAPIATAMSAGSL